jgi:prepilin-type N-terminal cleavage/methylation domain-containing protein
MKNRGGFTLVELVVVIVAVSVLAGLAVIGITRYQADTRDAQRSAHASTISDALESYYTKNGNYPSCQAVTADADTVISKTLTSLSKEDLTVPGSQTTNTNDIRCGNKLALEGDDFIEYKGDGSSACLGSGSCSSYTLIYRNELSRSLKEVTSNGLFSGQTLPNPSVTAPTETPKTTLGAPTLSVTVNSPSQVTANWIVASDTPDDTTYTVLRATNSAFTTGVITTTGIEDLNEVASGLANGRTYYFKVQAISGPLKSEFSNVASNVITPATPVDVSVTANSASQVTVSWAAALNATGYTVKYGLSQDTLTNIATSKTNTILITKGLAQGTEIFFQVYGTNNGTESAGSSVAKVVTTIAAPSAFSLTNTNDTTSITGDAKAASCPAGTTKYYSWKANGTSWIKGTNNMRVTYPLSNGQTVILQAGVRCQKGSALSEFTISSNSVTFKKPGMDLKLIAGDDSCVAEYCGRTINTTWTNICRTASASIKAKQLGTEASWTSTGASSDAIKWKGASKAGVPVHYYEVNIGCASSSATLNVISAYKCTGCK